EPGATRLCPGDVVALVLEGSGERPADAVVVLDDHDVRFGHRRIVGSVGHELTARSGGRGVGSHATRGGNRRAGTRASRDQRTRTPSTPTATAGTPTDGIHRWCE